nr:hypothetical protein [Desulfobulbus oralis]
MNLPIGTQVFINSGAMFTNLGGISLEERVLIGPHATIISVNHPLDPAERRGATILLGVSVGGKHRCGGRRGGARRHAA